MMEWIRDSIKSRFSAGVYLACREVISFDNFLVFTLYLVPVKLIDFVMMY